MALNIKNDETERLSRELARVTGETLTTAVTEAVRERLTRIRAGSGPGRVDAARLLALGRRTAPALGGARDDDLYGPDGLYR